MGKQAVKSINTKEYDVLIALLKQIREEAKLTPHAFSKLLGQEKNYIAKIEEKGRRIDVVEFLQVARSLGRDPVNLFAEFVEHSS